MELARALADHDVSISLATMGARLSRDQRKQARGVGNVEIYESSLKLEWMENAWNDVQRAGNWLLEVERRTKPDLVHFNGYAHAAWPFRSPKIVAGHSCVLSWWNAVRKQNAPAAWDSYRERVRAGIQSADLVVASTRTMLDQLKRFYGPMNGRVIHNGRDHSAFKPSPKEEFVFTAGKLGDEAKTASSTFVMGISHNMESLTSPRRSRAWQSDTQWSGNRGPSVWSPRTNC